MNTVDEFAYSDWSWASFYREFVCCCTADIISVEGVFGRTWLLVLARWWVESSLHRNGALRFSQLYPWLLGLGDDSQERLVRLETDRDHTRFELGVLVLYRCAQDSYSVARLTSGCQVVLDCVIPSLHTRDAVVHTPMAMHLGVGARQCWSLLEGLWQTSAPSWSSWCDREELPMGVKQNWWAIPESCFAWYGPDEPLSGSQAFSALIMSVSFENIGPAQVS